MNKISNLFVILESRLGLRFAPIGHTIPNLGVENGGEAIWQMLNKNNQQEKLIKNTFSNPEKISNDKYLPTVFELYQKASLSIVKEWRSERLISLGGDHSISQISLTTVLNHFPENEVGVIMFDSHADLHLPTTSPTGNFHGMWLRSFFDQFSENKIQNKKIKSQQLRYVGNLLTEAEEERFIEANKVTVYSADKINTENSKQLEQWSKKYQHLHISFDIDVFKEELCPATGTPNPSGLSKEQVLTMLLPLFNHSSISLDIVEFNPEKDGADKTLKLIEEIFEPIINLRHS